MFGVSVNYLAILAAGIAAMIVGFVWYSPAVFGKTWMQIIGMDPNDKEKMERMKKSMGSSYVLMFIGALAAAWVLDVLIMRTHAMGLQGALKVGLAAWLLVVPVQLGNAMFAGREDKGLVWKHAFISWGHDLVGFLAMTAILGWWK